VVRKPARPYVIRFNSCIGDPAGHRAESCCPCIGAAAPLAQFRLRTLKHTVSSVTLPVLFAVVSAYAARARYPDVSEAGAESSLYLRPGLTVRRVTTRVRRWQPQGPLASL